MEKNYHELADIVFEAIYAIEKNPGRNKVPAGMKGLAGELLTLSKLHSLPGINHNKIKYLGGIKRYDIDRSCSPLFFIWLRFGLMLTICSPPLL